MSSAYKVWTVSILYLAVTLLFAGLQYGFAADSSQEKMVRPLSPATGQSQGVPQGRTTPGVVIQPKGTVQGGGAVIREDSVAPSPPEDPQTLEPRPGKIIIDDANTLPPPVQPVEPTPGKIVIDEEKTLPPVEQPIEPGPGKIIIDEEPQPSIDGKDYKPTPPAEEPKASPPSSPLTPGAFLPVTPFVEDKTPEPKPAPPVQTNKPKKTEEPPVQQAKLPDTPKPGTKAPAIGDKLSIPPDAAQKGDLSFLEGCWRGTRPEYFTKRTVVECFCFSDSGGGKRIIKDPAIAGECTGATKGRFSSNGELIVGSEQGYCTNGLRWGSANMRCQGSGENTHCYWQFPDARGGTQQYDIPFYKVPSCQ